MFVCLILLLCPDVFHCLSYYLLIHASISSILFLNFFSAFFHSVVTFLLLLNILSLFETLPVLFHFCPKINEHLLIITLNSLSMKLKHRVLISPIWVSAEQGRQGSGHSFILVVSQSLCGLDRIQALIQLCCDLGMLVILILVIIPWCMFLCVCMCVYLFVYEKSHTLQIYTIIFVDYSSVKLKKVNSCK